MAPSEATCETQREGLWSLPCNSKGAGNAAGPYALADGLAVAIRALTLVARAARRRRVGAGGGGSLRAEFLRRQMDGADGRCV